MAEGGNVPELGGYDYEFTSKVPEDLECPVCHLTMKDPVQILGCGHRLCNICMESLLRRSMPCPSDRKPVSRDKIFPDEACNRKILDLVVKCPHVGCSWTGELRAVKKHESECPFKVVKCQNTGCTEELIMQDLRTHMSYHCSWRKINCIYCQELIIVNQKQEHFSACPKFPVECTNKCGLRDIPREKHDAHVRDDCPLTEVQCDYKNFGCEGKFPRSNTKSHSETEVERHLNLALRGLEATQLQVNELVSLVKDQSQQIEKMVSKEKEQAQKIETLMRQNREQAQQMWGILQNPKMFSSFELRISNFRIAEGRIAIDTQERFSEPFYVCGYRYSLKIIIGSNVQSYYTSRYFAQLLIKVIPGEFDSLLVWPCTHKVCVTLIDQNLCKENRYNISEVINFEKGEVPCTRPLTEDTHEYRNIHSRYLDRFSFDSRTYFKGGTIFIMVNSE